MRKQSKDRIGQAIAILGLLIAFTAGGWVGTRWVSPCVCIYAEQNRVN